MFVLYGCSDCLAALVVSRAADGTVDTAAKPRVTAPLGESRSDVYALAALFSLDAFGGGFMVQSMLALWLFQRFGFRWRRRRDLLLDRLLDRGFVSRRGAHRPPHRPRQHDGVHAPALQPVPASLIPFMPSCRVAIALLFVRAALSQMDVPTRSSYVMAIVSPAERAAAASITSVPRSLASAASPFSRASC